MKNRTTFKEGDQVFDILHGWGKVTYLYSSDWEKSELDHLVCRVKFDNGKECHYTKYVVLKSLSFTEYGFDEKFSQERPIDYEKCVGKWGKFWDDDEIILISKLVFYDDAENENYPFESEFNCHMNFEPLTEEQVKILELG